MKGLRESGFKKNIDFERDTEKREKEEKKDKDKKEARCKD